MTQGPIKGPCTSETAAIRWFGPLATPCNPPPAIRRRFFFGRCMMSDALKRAEHYRDLAKGYLRLAASTENPNHYLRIAVQCNALAGVPRSLTKTKGDGLLSRCRRRRAR